MPRLNIFGATRQGLGLSDGWSLLVSTDILGRLRRNIVCSYRHDTDMMDMIQNTDMMVEPRTERAVRVTKLYDLA